MAHPGPSDRFDAALLGRLRQNALLLASFSIFASVSFAAIDALAGSVSAVLLGVRIASTAVLGVLLAAIAVARGAAVVPLAMAVPAVDALIVTAIVPLTGGAASDLFPMFFVAVMLPALVFTYRPPLFLVVQGIVTSAALATTLALATDPRVTAIRCVSVLALSVMSTLVGTYAYRSRRRELEAAESLRARDEALDHTQAQLIQAERLTALGTLSACIAHELNQPLTVLNGYTSLLAKRLTRVNADPTDVEALSKQVETIRHAAERMSTIISRLRNFARRSERATTLVNLDDVAKGAVFFVEHELRARDVELALSLAATAIVRADRTELEQVALNLLTNARDAVAAAPAPRIQLSTRVEADRAVLEVRDNGPGLSEEIRSQLFQPFFTTKPPGQGTGLGLSVSQLIARRHGGALEALEGAGPGACFRLTLPLAEPAAERTRAAAP